MPTLEGIEGSSLQPSVQLVERFGRGAQLGEQVRNIRQRTGIDQAISAGAQVTGGAVTSGAPSAPQGAPQGVAASAQQSGQVDPNRPAFNPIVQMERTQQQLMKVGGAQGLVAARAMQPQIDKAREIRDTAIEKELQGISRASRFLRGLKDGDRVAAIGIVARESQGDPRMLKWIDKLKKATPQEQDLMLARGESNAISALEREKQDREDRKLALDETGQSIERDKVAATMAGIDQRNARLDQDKIEHDLTVQKYEELDGKNQIEFANKNAGPLIQKALNNANEGREYKSVLQRSKHLAEKMIALNNNPNGPTATGLRADIVNTVRYVDADLADQFQNAFNSAGGADMAVLQQLSAQVYQKAIGQTTMKGSFSDKEGAAVAATIPDAFGSTLQGFVAQANEAIETVEASIKRNTGVVRAAADGGGQAVFDLAVREEDIYNAIDQVDAAVNAGEISELEGMQQLLDFGFTEDELKGRI